jgi:hypothetical protein
MDWILLLTKLDFIMYLINMCEGDEGTPIKMSSGLGVRYSLRLFGAVSAMF